ncbi:hypothetical protein E4U13_008406 [Claviceps humidiphila]|uniref:Pyridoxamine 5'-phosphate oxidase Alr4036 family FMN-binding domain-containing protein n=1 Tax=Claviceps humidiphila TaxID=1294629 RepID=A0A9P7TRP4_9HYPO|nr:hypothetical protein E4U13_008406 [Claviceps humidiphila]
MVDDSTSLEQMWGSRIVTDQIDKLQIQVTKLQLLSRHTSRPGLLMVIYVRSVTGARIERLSQQFQRKISSRATNTTTIASSMTVAAAPWREAFKSDMESMKPPNFTLSSVYQVSPSKFLPRARTVVYRGMWASLVPNSKNPATLNAACYESDLPTITTDARMHKVSEMFSASTPAGSSSLSAKGGPIEAVFWAAESNTQWRLRGHVYMIGPDIDSDHATSVRESLLPYMRKLHNAEAGTEAPWSWSRELTAHFGNVSPSMRGTFRNPPPGTPISEKPEQGLCLGQKVEDVQDEVARQNFRVLVIVPEEVDRVDLAAAEGGRRWKYTLEGESWKETELWP